MKQQKPNVRFFRRIFWSGAILLLVNFGTLFAPEETSAQTDDLVHFFYFPRIFKTTPPEPTKGIALIHPTCADLDLLGVEWYQNNGVYPTPGCLQLDHRFVPRIYNAASAHNSAVLAAAVANARISGWLIGYTEPNLLWHSNITPQEGARAWRVIEQAAIPAGVKLVLPSPSQHPPGQLDPLGFTWIWHMIDAYEAMYGEKPHFDAMGWNYYAPNVHQLKIYFQDRRREALSRGYDVPFWVMEYAGECWDRGRGNVELMKYAAPWFEETPWITRYAWFTHRINPTDVWAVGWESCSLIHPATGHATSLGVLYAGY